VVGPASGHLASGQVGPGRMIEPAELFGHIRQILGREGPLAGLKVLVTAGGTEEPIDPVRSITNRSSGKQGFALAQAALDLGAQVILVAGLTSLPTPVGAQRRDVRTAERMLTSVTAALPEIDVLIMAAAVADFRPSEAAEQKIKKDSGPATIQLALNPDILATVGRIRQDKGYPEVVVGFAAESQALVENAEVKLKSKKLDLIIANDISAQDAGFAVDNNRVTLLDAGGKVEALPLMSKDEVAARVMEWIISHLYDSHIVHICRREDWIAAQEQGEYRAASLQSEGFIHCSKPGQVLAVANRYYHGEKDLLLLWIKPRHVISELRYDPVGNDQYPHIYGPLNLDAVYAIRPLESDLDGVFLKLPDGNE
jgi:uncharacterized protein (DUF952 family)